VTINRPLLFDRLCVSSDVLTLFQQQLSMQAPQFSDGSPARSSLDQHAERFPPGRDGCTVMRRIIQTHAALH
jgi:hypothetical protein